MTLSSRFRRRSSLCDLPIYRLLVCLLLPLISTWSSTSFTTVAAQVSVDIVNQFHDPDVQRMNHLVVDKNTGRVYVGAVNHLYQFSPDLNLVVKVVTGPQDDALTCSTLDCPRETVKKLADDVNKVLVIDYTTTRLISCGSLFQGICTARNLHNITDVVQKIKEPVVANNATASTFAFIAPGPPNPPVSQVMYVGVTFTGNSPYRAEVPAVSSRSLDKDKMLNIAESAVTTGTRIFVNSLARERYPINYIYGFSSEGFSYFFTTQYKDTAVSAYISKLVRVCQEDKYYYSYTEVPIECATKDRSYNLVQAAYVGKAGSVLAGDLGITAQDDVLFAVFAESVAPNSDRPLEKSALCVYSLKAIRRNFMRNIQRCFSGEGQRGLDFISPSHDCVPTPPIPVEPWTEVYDARDNTIFCIQYNTSAGAVTGSEDCLYINIQTPVVTLGLNQTTVKKKRNVGKKLLSVIFWIYGGAFLTGNPLSESADYYIENDIIFVSLSYRSGVFGYLAIGHPNATGNVGPKDIVFGLKWVQKNIERFGGNPNNVTLAGGSSGASLVHYVVLSDSAAGLFHGVITVSGAQLCMWSFHSPAEALHYAEGLAYRLGLEWTDKESLLRAYQNVDATAVVNLTTQVATTFGPFRPTIEDINIATDPFLTECSIMKYFRGNFTKVPHILGYTDQETVVFTSNINRVRDTVSEGYEAARKSHHQVYPSIKLTKYLMETSTDFYTEWNYTTVRKFVNKLQTLAEDFCGLDVNTPLGGQEPMKALPVITFETLLTAVAATSTGDYTVVFIGTNKGHLKKVVVESSLLALEYGDLEIEEGSPVNPDLLFDSHLMHLYVLTEKKVSKVKVQECSVYKTCWDCLGAKDPYCGWCSIENKCNLRSDCQDAAKDPLYWISYKSGRCTTITTVTPDQLQRTTARTLELVIDNLPTLKGQFLCAFSALDKTLITNATRKSYGVNCTTPRTDLLPSIPAGQHHFTAKLSVRMTNGPDLVATNFTFFDCNTYSSCTQCVSSTFPCDWCVDGHRCTHDTAENCRNDILVTGVARMGPSYRSGPGFCPTINGTDSHEILVSSGIKKAIRVKVHIIGQFIIQTRFVCQFNIEGRVTSVTARLLADTIYCEETEFSYTSRTPNITVPFAVIWGGSKPLDNPDNIHVVIYRCRDMADNCGMCLAIPAKYECGWCQSSDRCEVKEQCNRGNGIWLNRNMTCPNPEIHSFEPTMGPWEGNTNVTIRGINLGKTFSDIYGGVTVAGVTCQPYEHLYIRTKQIVCRLDGPGQTDLRQGPVIVKIEDFRGQSSQNYEFVDPQISSISPKYGPMSGGTIIKITGKYMNAGSKIRVYIDQLPCSIISAESNETLCITSASDVKRIGKLCMIFDGTKRDYNGFFEYVDDPTIDSVESGVAGQIKIPKGIPAGGIKINVTGKNLGYIQHPQMYVYYDEKMFVSRCEVRSQNSMDCRSPTIEVPEDVELDAERPLSLEYGFRMDNVTGVQNLSQNGFNKFLLYPNPIYDVFDEEVKYYKSDYLTINGQNLDRACREADVIVEIGNSFCNVTSLSRQQLTCRPPETQPPALNAEGLPDKQELPEVIVIVGQTLSFKIGKMSYALPAGLNGPLSKPALMGVIAAIVVLVLVFIAFLIAYRRKSTESNRVLKNMQEQMDILELRVAAECKEAFAELQTEMTDLTGDVTSGGIPFLDYRTYAMKILFPNVENHVVLQWDRPELLRKEKGLRLFGQLIMNKTFLLLFVRTLESNRYFSMRDRVNVASLIMVTLQSKMEYCTDILKTLLAELIEKCMEGKSHPKLLLRRTESVAEKMLSAWFTFLLYKFMRECAGEPLYMLFRAMKQQVDKGPVDAITSEARYSLSEEKLIRQSIDFKPITAYASISQQTVFVGGLDPNTENVPVKVLDCDTISQVKEKALDTIYRATPYSQRPRKDDLDLEWRTGASGRLILYDEDSTTKTEGEWKKRNTLNHYRVPDGASLNLVSKQSSSIYNLSILSEKNDKSHKYETLNLSKFSSASPPLSRATSPLNHDHDGGLKSWHLVKHHDTDAQKEGERGNKMVSEIYLTRLLATKGTLQKFVDDLFETIFSTAHRGSALPLAIKYMFDFLDDQALHHGISDPEVVHTWKSNSLPLRFWVNLIKNPNFVFDIHKSNIVDSCLSVVAQTFMDSCSTSDHRLGKDSPSSKLLYAKDIPVYKEWVERYYSDIKIMPAISDQDMNAMLAEESRQHTTEFNTNCALYELYTYAGKYNEQLIVTLEEDEFSQKQRLAYKLEQVHNIMAADANP